MPFNEPPVKHYGEYADYSIENATVDRLGITTVEVHVTKPDPVDYQFLTLNSAPKGAVNLPCVTARLVKGKGQHTFVYTFDGKIEPGETGTDEVYSLDGNDSNESIETHPQFLGLVKKYGGTYNADGSFAGFPKTMPGDAKTKNPLYGVTDYLSIGWVWSRSYTALYIPQSAYLNAGCIESPTGREQPPQLNGTRNWLKLAPVCTKRGNVYAITERWQASGRNGANADIYRKISGA